MNEKDENLTVEDEVVTKNNETETNEEEIVKTEEEIKELNEDELNEFKKDVLEFSNEDIENNEDIKEFNEVIKEQIKEGSLNEKEYEEFKNKVVKKASSYSDKAFDNIIDTYLENSKLNSVERAKYKQMFIKHIKTQQALHEEFEEERIECDEEIRKEQEKLDNLFKELKYSELLESLEKSIKIAEENNKTDILIKYKKFYEEVDGIINLTNMKNKVKKIKNPKRILDIYEENFEIEFKKFYMSLKKNRNFSFIDPRMIPEVLEDYLPEDKKKYAKIFLYSLFRFINPKGSNINDNSVFIEGIIRNIYCLKTDRMEEEEKEKFINNIYEYVDMIIGE